MSAAEQNQPEITEVREAHRFDVKRLEDWCRENVDGFSGSLEVRQFEATQRKR